MLIVDNGSTAISLSNIGGPGTFIQAGAAATTLLANSYGGGTTIRGGSLLAGAATSLGMTIKNREVTGRGAEAPLYQCAYEQVDEAIRYHPRKCKSCVRGGA